jgi:hypothetical protein
LATDKALYEDFQRVGSYRLIAERRNLNEDSVRGRVGRYARAVRERRGDVIPFDVDGTKLQPTYRLTGIPTLRHPALVVFADVHLPYTEWNLFELMIRFAEKHMPKGQRVGAIVGDFLNLDSMSTYDHIVPPFNLDDELDYAEYAVEYLLTVFDKLYWRMGNHDMRLVKRLAGALGAKHLARMIYDGMRDERLNVGNMTQMIAIQNNTIWRLSHQRNYSRNRGIVAARLALKHECNTITHHEHHVAMTRDDYNRYTVINNGMLADYEKMAYVVVTDSTSPVMCQGFTYLHNGVGHLLTPYATFTDWDRWGMEREALPAIVEAENKARRLTLPDENSAPVAAAERQAAA